MSGKGKPPFRFHTSGETLEAFTHYPDLTTEETPGGWTTSIVTCLTCEREHVCIRPAMIDTITCPYCELLIDVTTEELVQ